MTWRWRRTLTNGNGVKHISALSLRCLLTSMRPVSGVKLFAGSSVVTRAWIAAPLMLMFSCTSPSSSRDLPSATPICARTRSTLRKCKKAGNWWRSRGTKAWRAECVGWGVDITNTSSQTLHKTRPVTMQRSTTRGYRYIALCCKRNGNLLRRMTKRNSTVAFTQNAGLGLNTSQTTHEDNDHGRHSLFRWIAWWTRW